MKSLKNTGYKIGDFRIGRKVKTGDGQGVIEKIDWNTKTPFPIKVKYENGSGWYGPYPREIKFLED